MNDLNELMRQINRYGLFLLSGCLLIWAVVPALQPYAAGLVLGASISLINARILGLKIFKITEVVLANNGKRVNSGFLGRIGMVLIGTMISIKFPQFHLATTVIGFFFVQVAAFFFGLFSNSRLHKGKR